MDDKEKAAIIAAVTPLMGLGAVLAAAAAAMALKYLTTNYRQSSMAGDKEMKPTDDEVTISKSEVAGVETEGKAVQDTVSGLNGEVKAEETEARALTGEATAADSGASALRGKLGAADIETKTLKMT
jgi:hypothetical protein